MFKKLIITVFLFIVSAFTAGDLSAQTNVNDYSGLSSAIGGSATNITFTTDTIKLTGNLPAIGYAGPVDFYGPVTLDGSNSYQIFNLSNTSVSFHDNVNFINGSSVNGGAIYVNKSVINFSGDNIIFNSNKAGNDGGALWASQSTMSFVATNGNVEFTSNSATGSASYGGAVNTTQSTTDFIVSNGDIIFGFNKITGANGLGGAIYEEYSKMSFDATDGNILFTSNSVPSGSGGAIYAAWNSTMSFTARDGNIEFTSNNASGSGGAVGTIQATMNLSVSTGNIIFSSNSAGMSGGALNAGRQSTMDFDVSNGDIIFSLNRTINANNNGGAIYADQSTLNLSVLNGNIIFTSNSAVGSAYSDGGAIYTGNSTMTFTAKNGNIEFNSNASLLGGAIYATDSESMNFNVTDGNIKFTSNGATNLGGALVASNAAMNFNVTNGNIEFSSNKAVNGSGGAIYTAWGSTISFNAGNGNIEFNSNSAGTYGGAIYNENSIIKFADANVIFSGNMSGSYGGAVYNSGSLLNFDMSAGNAVTFSENTANYGGAIFNGSAASTAAFTNGEVTFIGNYVANSGGAIYNYNNSELDFTSSLVKFINNSAVTNGGAIDAASGSNTNFSGGEVIFEGNKTGASGGAIYNGLGMMSFDGSAVAFNGNTAANGGAIYNNAGSTAAFVNGNVTFTGNEASNSGGAIYNKGLMNLSGGAIIFDGNTADASGGAIFLDAGGAVNFNTGASEMNILFENNMAGGVLNDIYFADSDSTVNFNAADCGITLANGIKADGIGTINKTGNGSLTFGGDSVINSAFKITGGDVVFLNNATFTGTSFDLPSGSALDMNNGTVNTVNTGGKFASLTNLKMDVFSDGTNDQIKSVTADIDGSINIFAGVGTYYKSEYDLIITSGTGSLNGFFASSSIFSADNSDLNYELKYEDGIVKLIVDGMHTTNFGDLSPLTYDQTETSKAFKKISENPGPWADILNEMVIRQNNGTDADIAAVKNFLSRTSGYFLANVIRNMAADSPNNEVYDKIRNHAAEHKTNSGLWVQLRGGLESFKKDDNSLEDYNDLSLGVMFGFDRFLADKLWNGDLMWGVYGRINKDNIEQGRSKADGNKNGLGLYGGYIKDSWELKAMLLGSYDRFSTERADFTGGAAKADINAVTMSGDIEAAIKIRMNDDMNFRPYAGIEAANTSYGGFKESGAGIYDLDTQSGNYLRTAGRVGAGLDYEKGIWIWYANVEGKYILDGTKPEITSRFMDTGIDFNSRGAKEGSIQIGAGLGGEVRITENWKGFANAKYYAAERYENLYGNVGVRYMFGKNKSKAEDAAEARKKAEAVRFAEEAKLQAAAVETQRQAEEAELQAEATRLEQARLEEERVKAEEARRIAEEAKITTEISDEDLAKQKAEAEERRKRPMLKTYTLTTHFKTNSYFLTDELKEQIKGIAQELKNYDYKRITIEGHTDSTGTKERNKKLSRQRARSVYDEFIKNGAEKSRMGYAGFADTMSVESNKTKEGRAANRRTEIFVE